MDCMLTIEDSEIKHIENEVKKAEELINEVIEYKKMNFIQRMLANKVYQDINLESADSILKICFKSCVLYFGNRDIYSISKKQEAILDELLNKVMKNQVLIKNFDEYLKQEKNKNH